MTFDMSYDDGGMCSVGGDFDAVWTEMMEEWQLHQVRLVYLRAALEGFVRLLHPDAAHPCLLVEAAERQLQHHAEALPVHARAVAEHLGHTSRTMRVAATRRSRREWRRRLPCTRRRYTAVRAFPSRSTTRT
ncbi:hypothetical protein ACFT4A_21110 [Streptomyces sp. NPDC057099]|uniref:hypothetical protein n=1 Tax=Streptomyces sp. NPDC057099 TaxID=3346019 RepID=UPI003636D659